MKKRRSNKKPLNFYSFLFLVIVVDELIKLYFKLPKESFELILRNAIIREKLFKAWKSFLDSDFDDVERITNKIFDDVFGVFLRQFEFFDIREQNPFNELIKSYVDFTNSMIKFWSSFFEVEERNLLKDFLDYWAKMNEKFGKVLEYTSMKNEIFQKLPLISKDAVVAISKAIESYEKFENLRNEYEKIILNAWKESNKKFVEELKTKDPEKLSFTDFINVWIKELSSNFDKIVKDETFVKVQSEMLHSLMDFLKYTRIFNESLVTPTNPFALKSEMDEAYKRIHDLKREVNELKKKVKKLEQKVEEFGK